MATTNALMDLGYDVGTLISTHTSEDWVGIVEHESFDVSNPR